MVSQQMKSDYDKHLFENIVFHNKVSCPALISKNC